jgi:colicin import membrane protein
MTGLFFFIALAAVLAAVFFFASHRTARAELAGKEAALRKLQEQAEGASKDAAGYRAEAKERREEAALLRDQLKEAKKRAFDQADGVRKAGGAPALREEIEKLTARLADARAEASAAAERARSLEAQASNAVRDLEREKAAAAQALAKVRAEAAQASQAATQAPAAAPAPAATDEGLLLAEKERADKADAKLAELRKKAVDLDRELKAARGRLETDRRVYMVQKGELDIAHDRHAELRRRYDALRKEHEELIDAVRQAAREEKRAQEGAVATEAPVPPASSPASVTPTTSPPAAAE